MSMSDPWITAPMAFHGSRDPGPCDMTAAQCAWKWRHWTNWYIADIAYSQPTICFCVAAVGIFLIGHVLSGLLPKSVKSRRPWLRAVSAVRALAYKSPRIGGWNAPSIGFLLLGAAGAIFFFAMTLGPKPYYWPNTKTLSYGSSPPLATRAGYLALGCMPFVFILSSKANFITAVTGIAHEKLNLLHNWLAWAMFVLALIHTFPFIVYHEWFGDMIMQWNMGGTYVTGVITLIAQAWLTFMSIRKIRERYYEFFKATHIFFAVVFFVFFFIHCDYVLTTWDYFVAAAVPYALSWLYSLSRTYIEYGIGHRAHLCLNAEGTLQITIPTNSTWKPGQHVYLRFITCGLHALAAHPFTICSVPRRDRPGEMIFYAKPRGGLTKRLAALANKTPNYSVPVLLDGPYGGLPMRWAEGFDHAVVVGGGAGAGFVLPAIESFILQKAGRDDGSQLTAVVVSRTKGFQGWFVSELEKLATRCSVEDAVRGLTVLVHQSSDADGTVAQASESSKISDDDLEKRATTDCVASDDEAQALVSKILGVQLLSGRPDITALASAPLAVQGASVGLVVCGPGSMVHEVSAVAAEAQTGVFKGSLPAREVWLHKESFTY